MQERLAAEHAGELLGNALEHLLNRRGVPDEAHRHLQPLRRDVADAALHVVRNPLDKVRGVLVLNVKHLLINLLRRHAAAEETSRREVAPVARISSTPLLGIFFCISPCFAVHPFLEVVFCRQRIFI